MQPEMLTATDVLKIHESLVIDFAESGDPMAPPGIRSQDLLESAIARQVVSLDGILKYPDPIHNAATLLYGICNNHPFYNGNKRTALVAMLVHLDKNKFTLFNTSQKDLYDLMIKVASHDLEVKADKRSQKVSSDQEIEKISQWIRERIDRIKRGEKCITYRELRKILASFGLYLENPHNNNIDIIRYEKVKKGFLRQKEETVAKHIGTISWPGENREVAIKEIKQIRKIYNLSEEDGIDSESFYNYQIVIDSFVNRYRTTLRRLARV